MLNLLTLRDRIQHLIDKLAEEVDPPEIPAQVWLQLTQADADLRDYLLPKLADYKPLKTWRDSLKLSDRHWWWFPEPPTDPKDPYAWFWGGCTIIALTLSLALAQDIATRFLAGAPGVWSSIGAIAPVVVALLASGSALTKLGQQMLESLLSNKGPKKSDWPRIKFGASALLFAGLLTLHYAGLPYFACNFNETGKNLYKDGQWASAQNHFERSLSLAPDFPDAQFNLGTLYEEYQEADQAQEYYLRAVKAGYLPAFNNLARLYIQQEKYDDAAQLLRLALTDENLPDTIENEPTLKYVLRKNLGWARLEQERLLEAETELREAIRLNANLDPPRPDAHCLLAQVLQVLDAPEPLDNESDGNSSPTIPDTAKAEWEQCLRYANRPEYDRWEGMARQALSQP